jgi:pre-rRNA-processing protein IPI1
MGGAGRRKFKKLEKAKIKLKGAKLPKGTNVTKTNFKVKKILLPEQLKERNLQEALSHKKLSVKDCLAKLRNGNSASRTDGLRGIREIVGKYPGEVDNNLGPTVQAVASLAVDLERDIRRDCYKTFSLIFSATQQRNIFPFFDILASYLKCAMTHIQPTIQEDSLLLMDVYLQHLPQLVLGYRDKIVPPFLDMISKLRSEAKPERTLTLSLNRQSTSAKWRSRVLVRLSGILKVGILGH